MTCGVDIWGEREERRPLRVARLGGEAGGGESEEGSKMADFVIFTHATWRFETSMFLCWRSSTSIITMNCDVDLQKNFAKKRVQWSPCASLCTHKQPLLFILERGILTTTIRRHLTLSEGISLGRNTIQTFHLERLSY
jgi:hypothetical protein